MEEFCHYCDAPYSPTTRQALHIESCPYITGLYPVTTEPKEIPGFHCFNCMRPIEVGDSYTRSKLFVLDDEGNQEESEIPICLDCSWRALFREDLIPHEAWRLRADNVHATLREKEEDFEQLVGKLHQDLFTPGVAGKYGDSGMTSKVLEELPKSAVEAGCRIANQPYPVQDTQPTPNGLEAETPSPAPKPPARPCLHTLKVVVCAALVVYLVHRFLHIAGS